MRALLSLLVVTAAFAAPASAMYIPPLGACAGSQCPNGDSVCVWSYCEDLTMAISCTSACATVAEAVQESCDAAGEPCDAAMDAAALALQAVGSVTPVGACVGAWHCSYQGTACVQAGDVECRTVYTPAHCTGSFCGGEWACVYGAEQDGTSRGDGTCTSDACDNRLCDRVCDNVCETVTTVVIQPSFGTCSGSPTAYDPNQEHCHGGIACTEQNVLSRVGDPCVELMMLA